MQLRLAEYIGVDIEYSKICTIITVSVDNIGKIFFRSKDTAPFLLWKWKWSLILYRLISRFFMLQPILWNKTISTNECCELGYQNARSFILYQCGRFLMWSKVQTEENRTSKIFVSSSEQNKKDLASSQILAWKNRVVETKGKLHEWERSTPGVSVFVNCRVWLWEWEQKSKWFSVFTGWDLLWTIHVFHLLKWCRSHSSRHV